MCLSDCLIRDRYTLLLFHKRHCEVVFIEKDKHLTLAHGLKVTRSSHSAQDCRYQTYSDTLKKIVLLHPHPPPPPPPPPHTHTRANHTNYFTLGLSFSFCGHCKDHGGVYGTHLVKKTQPRLSFHFFFKIQHSLVYCLCLSEPGIEGMYVGILYVGSSLKYLSRNT